MEVAASQWRREWAGKAEIGKVTEGGVTRNIARAMEVLHATAPGAKVRVMRAAYHSSAGPGAPSSSFLLHSSRQVLSSGYNFSEPLSLSSKPIEVSSTPLEASPEIDNEKLQYKVTEPDDLAISEPSKWIGSTGTTSVRFPSEESSSTNENMSIIDLDSRNSSRNTNSRNIHEHSDDNFGNINTGNHHVSSFLDAPVSLSTLKYTSLLYGSDEWNNRRKSYSFEDTSPLNKINFHQNHPILLDSSTDSGICKSTEIINDHNVSVDSPTKRHESKEKLYDLPSEDTFQDWLNKNRRTSLKSTRISPLNEYRIPEIQNESNVSLQSKGKMTITLPIMIESDVQNRNTNTSFNDDNDRKPKKVEFCKTELHFAADSGTVNIIATDEKPPPSYDFRKKRSAFVPLNNVAERHITLFGEKKQLEQRITIENDFSEFDENTAATKSILKNKIPKPKPYLLGENMVIGSASGFLKNNATETKSTSLISSINKEQRADNFDTNGDKKYNTTYMNNNDLRTFNTGPRKKDESIYTPYKYHTALKDTVDITKPSSIPLNNALGSSKTRKLRDSDLTYFGIDGESDTLTVTTTKPYEVERFHSLENLQEEILQSVKLVQKISNSTCNSEAESEDQEYQNISSFRHTPPKPKPRTKYIDVFESQAEYRTLKPISEKENDIPTNHRRSRLKQQDTKVSQCNRSISEPPHKDKIKNTKSKTNKEVSPRRIKVTNSNNRVKSESENKKASSKSPTSTYENVYINIQPNRNDTLKSKSNRLLEKREKNECNSQIGARKQTKEKYGAVSGTEIDDNDLRDTKQLAPRKPKRTEKLVTPELTINSGRIILNSKDQRKSSSSSSSINRKSFNDKKDTLPRKEKINALSPLRGGDKKTIISSNVERKNLNYKTPPPKDSVYPSTIRNISPVKIKNKDDCTAIKKKVDEIKPSRSRKSKYVINYDDKNGTVSSICKITSNQDSLERKYTPTQAKHTTDNKTKITNKNIILQNQDQQRIFNRKKYAATSGKGKNHSLHKTCQLL